MSDRILSAVEQYYSEKLRRFGPTPKGVDWKDLASQNLRFDQLCRLVKTVPDATINEVGCGYGSFLEYLRQRCHRGAYCGIDLSAKMIEAALARHGNDPRARFCVGSVPPEPMDFAVSSGIFNVRLDISTADWEDYIRDTLDAMNKACREGLAFNCLTSYSDPDPEYMRDDLYYGDPCYWFDYCKSHLGRKVNLHHDYELYEFTIIVKK
jgi:SAM-dependent methyltransferase